MDKLPIKKKTLEETIQKVTGETPSPMQLLPIDDLIENPWNPNLMPDDLYQKMILFLRDLWIQSRYTYLPTAILVRPYPASPGKYQIIDGKHRRLGFVHWREVGYEHFDKIPCIVGHWDTKTCMLLTDALNYMRGEPNPEKRLSAFNVLHQEYKMPLAEIAAYVPMSEQELYTNLQHFEYKVTPVEVEIDEETREKRRQIKNEDWIECKATVSKEALQVIEQELARIMKTLSGKNLRGRALEYMAVLSSQTSLDSIE